MSDTNNKSAQRPVVVLDFPPIGEIRGASFFPPEVADWNAKWNAEIKRKAKLKAAKRWARLHRPLLRRALGRQIRLGSKALRESISSTKRLKKMRRMGVVQLVQRQIATRVGTSALFPLLLGVPTAWLEGGETPNV